MKKIAAIALFVSCLLMYASYSLWSYSTKTIRGLKNDVAGRDKAISETQAKNTALEQRIAYMKAHPRVVEKTTEKIVYKGYEEPGDNAVIDDNSPGFDFPEIGKLQNELSIAKITIARLNLEIERRIMENSRKQKNNLLGLNIGSGYMGIEYNRRVWRQLWAGIEANSGRMEFNITGGF